MQMPDKEMRTRDYGEWLCEVGKALIAELRGAQLSYRDAIQITLSPLKILPMLLLFISL